MELIKALEQLSLEVRNQRVQGTTRSGYQHDNVVEFDEKRTNLMPNNHQQQPVFRPVEGGDKQWQYPSMSNSNQTPNNNLNQLDEFDNSIRTLFSQISELEPLESKPRNCASLRRAQFGGGLSTLAANNHASSGSVETSQEEDSDCSSQQSGLNNIVSFNNNNSNADVNPLVRDLLKRDLDSITDSMRKISKILTIGNEIETIYNNLSKTESSPLAITTTNQLDDDNHYEFFSNNHQIDLPYISSLCDNFTCLCGLVPHIMDLPTIIRYTEYCQKLSLQIKNLNGSRSINDQYAVIENFNKFNHDLDSSMSLDEGEGEDDDDFDEDVSSLNFDNNIRRVDNWTENKLYINNQNN